VSRYDKLNSQKIPKVLAKFMPVILISRKMEREMEIERKKQEIESE
jgi:hypothetical protein